MSLPRDPTIAVKGKDGRSDGLTAGVVASAHSPTVIGISEFKSPGMLQRCDRVYASDGLLSDAAEMMHVLREVQPDLLIIGPEEPLLAGIVNHAEDELGIPCFGPRQELARIETSKSWTRELVSKYSIHGNPEHRIFRDENGLERYLRSLDGFVVKPDGLTGGKGVKLSGEHLKSVSEALDYAHGLIHDDGVVVVEERLEGEEFSLQTITDGETAIHCPIVQDHKRAFDGDLGPNTGGMGSYSYPDFSLPFLSDDDVALAKEINERVIRALQAEVGKPYRGVLYGGFMATRDGIRLIEYNARFGDPEAMNVLSILSSDLLELCWGAATGTLSDVSVRFDHKATVCKYVVPAGYPTDKNSGDVIELVDDDWADGGTRLYWAAVNEIDSKIILTGSRALAFVGVGDTLEEAEKRASAAVKSVRGPVRYRSDIGTAAAVAARVDHMRLLRS
jgi:phosphoribosylamine--glycine ligase